MNFFNKRCSSPGQRFFLSFYLPQASGIFVFRNKQNTMNRIHISKVREKMEEKDDRNTPIPFSFRYAKKDGTLVSYNNATLSSIHFKGSTVNILPEGEKSPKTFRKICFLSFNEHKIYL